MNWYKESQGRYDHIPEKNKGGDCFTKAFEYIFQHGVLRDNNNLQLVHAIIQPLMGPLSGVEFGHAWVEDGENVIDTSRNNEVMNKETYYMLGGLLNFPTAEDFRNRNTKMTIKEEKITRYSIKDAKAFAVKHGYYGPWDKKFSDYVLENDEEE